MIYKSLAFVLGFLFVAPNAFAEDDHPGYNFVFDGAERNALKEWVSERLTSDELKNCKIAVPEFTATAASLVKSAYAAYLHENKQQPYMIFDGVEWMNNLYSIWTIIETSPDQETIKSVQLKVFQQEESVDPSSQKKTSRFVLKAETTCR